MAVKNDLSFVDLQFWFIPHEVPQEEGKEADSALLHLYSQSLNTCRRAKMILSAPPCQAMWKIPTQCVLL